MMELWDLFDQDRQPTGETHRRGDPLPAGRFHQVVHVWIRNSLGQYLISRRAADRPSYPLYWECTGGSVLAGESSLEGALREVKEEVGAALDPACGRVLFTLKRQAFGDFADVWLFCQDAEADLKNAALQEVAQMCWMDPAEIRRLWDAGHMVPTLAYFFDEVAGQ